MHCSLFALYGLGGWLVQRKLLPIRVLLSAIGFTFSLVFATQGVVQTLADTRKVTSSMQRWSQSSFAHCYLVQCILSGLGVAWILLSLLTLWCLLALLHPWWCTLPLLVLSTSTSVVVTSMQKSPQIHPEGSWLHVVFATAVAILMSAKHVVDTTVTCLQCTSSLSCIHVHIYIK